MFQNKEILSYKWTLLTIFLLLIAYFSNLSTLELRAEEPRRAVIALEMYFSGEYILPKIHDWNYYNKPPLFNWILASAFYLIGSTAEWVVRLPALLSWIGTAIVLFYFSRKYVDNKTAFLSSLFLLTFGDVLLYGSVNSGEIDLFFSSLVFLQIASIFYFEQRKSYVLLFVFSYILTALAFLTKGLPACAFQAITLLSYFICIRKWKLLFGWKHFIGIGLFLLITGTYFYSYHQQSNAFPFLVNLVNESANRSVSEHSIKDIAWHLLEFFPNLLKLLLPCSLLFFPFFKKGVWEDVWSNNLLRFCMIFIAANLSLYILSPGTLNRYLYPFFPFFAIILAYLLVHHTKIAYRHAIVVVALLAALRLTYNFKGMSYQQEHLKELMYRDLNDELWRITNGEKIYWTGEMIKQPTDLSLFGTTIFQDTIQIPPHLPYQIPYYLGNTGQYVFQYDSIPKSNTFYLAYESFIANKEVTIFHQFQERWTNRQLFLVKFK